MRDIKSKILAIMRGVSCTCLAKTPEIKHHKEECKYRMFFEKNKREVWVKEACEYMVSITGEWEYPEHLEDYCDSLYEYYVLSNSEDDQRTPKDAVDEDMTYWD